MGTWDVGPYDNDVACDLLADIRDGNFDFNRFRWTCEEGRLDADAGEVIIALATLYASLPDRLPHGVDAEMLAGVFTGERVRWLRRQLQRVLDPATSELYALWEATGELELWLAVSGAPLAGEER